MKKVLLNIGALLLLVSFSATAQIETPAPSPTGEMEQMVGLTEVEIEYSRPGKKGREIFSENGLVPYGKPWRLGANAATKFAFSDDVKIGGQKLGEGEYAVLATPSATEWKFMFYPYESGSWGSYLEKEPAAIVTAKAQTLKHEIETMTFMIDNIKNESADIILLWDNTMVSMPLEVNTDEAVMESIERVMGGPTANDYYAAAAYYHDAGKDLNQALAWIEKATSGDNPRFWQVRRKALILADLGKTEAAIKAAKQSMALAKEAGNEDYVRMNQKSIEEWSNK